MSNISKNLRINDRIQYSEIRLIGEDGSQLGLMSSEQALLIAYDKGLDLIEIAAKADPPVCKIMDYGKFRYEQEKLAKEAKKKQTTITNKEVRMRPNIEEHDYLVKFKNLRRFLQHGDKVKITVMFKGRQLSSINDKDNNGRKLLDRMAIDAEEYGVIDQLPKKEGRFLVMTMISHGKGTKLDAKDKNETRGS